tara:strand:- start:1858 stop:2634 length:777 start_codon:yes stop_codon:yes gene_type:complete
MLKKLFKFGPNKEDIIEVWSTIEGLPEVEPVKESHNFMPNWWVNSPQWQSEKHQEANVTNNISNKGTVKRCPAIPEFMSMGFVVPLWCDLRVEIFEDGSWKWNTPASEFSFDNHGPTQLADLLPKHARPEIVMKPNCPWRVRTPKGISLLQLPMFWHFNPNFTVAPGVIWTDIHHEINQQMMFHKKGIINLQRGTPLAHYIPIRREQWNMQCTNQTEELRQAANASYYHVRTKWGGGYPKHRKDQIKKGECPYHATSK